MLRAFDRGTTVYAGAASAPEDGAAVSCQGRRRCSWLGAAGRGTACFLGFSGAGAGGQRRCSVLVTGKGGGGGRSRSRRGGGGGRGDREGAEVVGRRGGGGHGSSCDLVLRMGTRRRVPRGAFVLVEVRERARTTQKFATCALFRQNFGTRMFWSLPQSLNQSSIQKIIFFTL
jgi:hypothetical protein